MTTGETEGRWKVEGGKRITTFSPKREKVVSD
jgi:hypothetical protein